MQTGAQAVHPGYGFLSENLAFCQLCTDSNIVFIGPPPNAIRAMGSKSESKDIMIKAKVPVTPGYHGSDQSNATLINEAQKIGYPLMIKAVSGGGGKGMRAVFEPSKFVDALESCRREAKKSFGDDAVLIEKLVQAPRHVELQVFGDKHGNAVHLLERDCSVQRRHQKVLEEAPASNLDPKIRKAMGDAAVACAKAVGYVGAGTVEFLVDSVTSDFYFCEMNTRLQVEHPVTEMITGTDLVEWQLRVASGQRLPMTQEEILARAKGVAIEARIYAENPLKDFLPATGKLVHLKFPTENKFPEENVRVDSGVKTGNEVSTFYDPMIAKLIAFGDSRPEALRKLERALRDFHVAGIANNIDFLVKIVRHPGFTEEQATTAFFEHHMKDLLKSIEPPSLKALSKHTALGVVAYMQMMRMSSGAGAPWGSDEGKDGEVDDWRCFGKVARTIDMNDSSDKVSLEVESLNTKGGFRLKCLDEKGKTIEGSSQLSCIVRSATLLPSSTPSSSSSTWNLSVEVEGSLCSGTVAIYKNALNAHVLDIWVEGVTGDAPTHTQIFVPAPDFFSASASSGQPSVLAPMPGKVIKVLVTDGQTVKRGDPIAIIEAMKMEHVVAAPCDGTVNVFCAEGTSVGDGFKLAQVTVKK